MSEYEKQPFENIRYRMRCCIPETSEGIVFDEMGICRGCQSAEHKMRINWAEREKELRKISTRCTMCRIFRVKNHKVFNENLARKESYRLSPLGNAFQGLLMKYLPEHICNIFVVIARKPS